MPFTENNLAFKENAILGDSQCILLGMMKDFSEMVHSPVVLPTLVNTHLEEQNVF